LEGSSIRSLAIVLLIIIVSFFPQAPFADSGNKTDHIFRIERSINKNFVQYDVRLMENGNLPDSNPVITYWVLENGQQEELTLIQRKYAYGIHSQEQIEKDKFRVILAALKDREIIVKKVNGSFRALVFINGIQSILERVYVESKPRLTGLPNVLYVDLFGRTKGINSTMRERIIPK
jgi:Domain of unknown function (DUF4833)